MDAAAKQGVPHAFECLQQLMTSGEVGAKLMTDSSKIVKERAKSGDKEAIFLLGINYLNGDGGFKKNVDEAEKHLRKASELNHPEADLCLGTLLLQKTKNEEGFHFIRRAAEKGENVVAQHRLGDFRLIYI
jgi:TPR repeat protein